MSALVRAALTFFAGLLWASPALACSLYYARLAQVNSVIESGYYWMASFLLAGVVICIEVYRGRLSLVLGLTVGLLIFHPTWTISAGRQVACGVFGNVLASRAELLLIGVFAALTLVRFVRSERSWTRFWRNARVAARGAGHAIESAPAHSSES